MLESYEKLIGKHEGEIAFVVGSGTSLHGKDISAIHDFIVITSNAGITMMDWSDGDPDKRYWVSNDALCRRWDYWPKVKSAKATKIVRESWNNYFDEIPDFLYFKTRPTPEHVVISTDRGLSYCSSAVSGLDLALQMGCKLIFLLGIDQYFQGSKSHFWQLLPYKHQPKRTDRQMATHAQQKWTFGYNDKAWPALRGFADETGATVYNCNPKSRVGAFEKISIEDGIRMAKDGL